MDTRRRAASDLVRGLCKFHEQRVIEIFSHHVVAMLQVTLKSSHSLNCGKKKKEFIFQENVLPA